MNDSNESSQGYTIKKKVDESWKDSVDKEKVVELPKDLGEATQEEAGYPEPNFPFFLSTLAMQALASLGEVPLNQAGEKRVDLVQAQYFIGILEMLAEKTKGNLSLEEDQMMKELLYELQLKFVKKVEAIAVPPKP